jgi:hypothetical protein
LQHPLLGLFESQQTVPGEHGGGGGVCVVHNTITNNNNIINNIINIRLLYIQLI